MDKATYQQLDRMEVKIDVLLKKLAPEAIEEPKEEQKVK